VEQVPGLDDADLRLLKIAVQNEIDKRQQLEREAIEREREEMQAETRRERVGMRAEARRRNGIKNGSVSGRHVCVRYVWTTSAIQRLLVVTKRVQVARKISLRVTSVVIQSH
jgi:hypothetical protein